MMQVDSHTHATRSFGSRKASYGDLVVCKTKKPKDRVGFPETEIGMGIRVEAENEKMAHQLHRADVDYIGGDLKQFRVGPLPFGTNKSSLTKAFRQWNWEARAGQPLTQTRDHSGVFWSAQAAGNPSHWIFTMQHGDVSYHPGTKSRREFKTITDNCCIHQNDPTYRSHRKAPK